MISCTTPYRTPYRRALAMLLAVCALPALSPARAAATKDVAGSRDHPLVGRYQGAVIRAYEVRGYDEIRLPDRAMPESAASADRDGKGWARELSGKITSIVYEGPAERSALEVLRNYQQALKAAGFSEIFFCRAQAKDCTATGRNTNIGTFWNLAKGKNGLPQNFDTSTYLLAEKDEAGRHVTVGLLGVEMRASGSRPLTPHVALTVVEAEPMQTGRIEVVEASRMQQALERNGKIAIYGIYFDTDSAELQPASTPQIEQLAELLKTRPALEVIVVGHTDGQGAFDYNLSLSRRRAQAVVDVLAKRYGIAAARMTPAGAGMVAPVASNRTEAGRALNRRVEIVERVGG